MIKFKKSKLNPIDLINNFWPEASTDHIAYDKNLTKGDYYIIRQCGGDGTMTIVTDMLERVLINVVNMQSYVAKSGTDFNKVKGVKGICYTVGPIRHATVFGMIKLGLNKDKEFFGQRDRARMAVKCTYIY